jgi:hypothetical protein
MKTLQKIVGLILIFINPLWSSSINGQNSNLPDVYYYGVEIGGVQCGYAETHLKLMNENGLEWIQLNEEVVLKLTILGQAVDASINNFYKIDPESGKYFYCERDISNGSVNLNSKIIIEGDIAFFTSNSVKEPKEIDLSDGVILESPIALNHLLDDFLNKGLKEINYQVLDDMKGEVVTKTYSFLNSENIDLAGQSFSTIVVKDMDQSSGVSIKYWIDDQSGFPVKFMYSGRTIYLADESVKKKLQSVDYDNLIFAKVGKLISNVQGLTYLKASAKLKSEGNIITVESLNFPGQSFTGTVEDNIIDGVFEIESIRYDGKDAPGFPFDFQLADSMLKYIEPEILIESDHPDLIKEARSITLGAENSWEASVRLSKWVAENIRGAVPGGTSAINTYITREGECGSHSRLLAAFCRAVDIPARLAVGCMYTTYYGGSFGQHAWTEVFMGNAGWMAVDATAFEYDFVDAGHIRLGELTSFHPKEMQIIDYRLGNDIKDEMPIQYKELIGNYLHPEANKVFKVLYQDGSLAVDVPNKMVLALNDPDEDGCYYPQISRQINFKFIEDSSGYVEDMRLQQLIIFPKLAEQDSISEDVSINLKSLVGTYSLAQANLEVRIFIQGKGLYISDPFTKTDSRIQQNVETGKWTIASNNNLISFEKDSDDNITQLDYFKNDYLSKQK